MHFLFLNIFYVSLNQSKDIIIVLFNEIITDLSNNVAFFL